MPFELRLPDRKPVAVGGMTKTELVAELMKGIESLRTCKSYTADEVDAELQKEFGI